MRNIYERISGKKKEKKQNKNDMGYLPASCVQEINILFNKVVLSKKIADEDQTKKWTETYKQI